MVGSCLLVGRNWYVFFFFNLILLVIGDCTSHVVMI